MCPYSVNSSKKGKEYSIEMVHVPSLLPSDSLPSESQEAVKNEVQSIYASGTPFFTKKAIQQVVDAFDDALLSGHPTVITIIGLDRRPIKFQLPSLHTYMSQAKDSDVELVRWVESTTVVRAENMLK
jgi:hypothetical protein